MNARSLRSIYQLKVSLKYISPPIWRRFQIVSTTNLDAVHLVLQIIMGWSDSHLHEFVSEYERYGEPDENFPSDVYDETKYRLDQVLKSEKQKLIYSYDFGDSWEHEVLLEKILPFDHGITLPACISGKRACPPEDVGGVGGYGMFLEAITDPLHPEYEEMRDWIGDDFDSEHFDLDAVNNLLRENCKR